ncbi:hypothetical protein Bbelb_140190 [Branchiostoma belcheri]|nr:hypothetical protein Bbelb_140190 [Branchiostoma belcheri]
MRVDLLCEPGDWNGREEEPDLAELCERRWGGVTLPIKVWFFLPLRPGFGTPHVEDRRNKKTTGTRKEILTHCEGHTCWELRCETQDGSLREEAGLTAKRAGRPGLTLSLSWRCMSIRWNLIFHGIQETERENCTRKVMDFISEEMNINTQEMKMCAVHGLGEPRNGKPRPVIARFTCRADRDRVWKNKAQIKDKRIFITDDVPDKVRELRRNILVPALKRVKEGGKRGMIVGNELVIESKQYNTGRIFLEDGCRMSLQMELLQLL